MFESVKELADRQEQRLKKLASLILTLENSCRKQPDHSSHDLAGFVQDRQPVDKNHDWGNATAELLELPQQPNTAEKVRRVKDSEIALLKTEIEELKAQIGSLAEQTKQRESEFSRIRNEFDHAQNRVSDMKTSLCALVNDEERNQETARKKYAQSTTRCASPNNSSKTWISRWRSRRRARKHRINLGDQVSAFYGNHRSGWGYAVGALNAINNSKGIYCDTFIERTFNWHPDGINPHQRPWVGFIHVPPVVPTWFDFHLSNDMIFQTEAWRKSLPYCRGLFTLSGYHRNALQQRFDFPVENLIHPTEIPDRLWSFEAFEKNGNKRILQLGYWLRKLHAIYQLPKSKYQKTLIKVSERPELNRLFDREKMRLVAADEFDDSMYSSVDVVQYLPNERYDEFLSQNIVFLQLYDASANNSVIECIARGTPLLINRIPPVVEYLGDDYPFYYETLEQAVNKANNFELVLETHRYLMDCDTRKKLSGDYFVNSLLESELLESVYQEFRPSRKSA